MKPPKSFFYAVVILLFFALSACIGIETKIMAAPTSTPTPFAGEWWQPVPGTSWQ
ncbi:MAG: hypothetical protein H8E28_13475, partial [Anaerolineae bacterium]|nr:hypothetical protein [Anaerolineae bacterium]